MSRGPFTPTPAIVVPTVTALSSLGTSDVPAGTLASVLETGDLYTIDSGGTWSPASGGVVTDAIIAAGSNLTDLPLAPTTWTLNGDVDGDYELDGEILFPAGSALTSYLLQPNADASNAVAQEIAYGTGLVPTKNDVNALKIGLGATNAGSLTFHARLCSKSGRYRMWTCEAFRYDAVAPSRMVFQNSGIYYAAAPIVFGPTTRIHADASSHILLGSYVRIRRLLNQT